ncbi:hypothetical protein SAMN05421877_10931 [Sphingobacterium lactis]|uniref:Uncharacterized protein n=1 Tax=Sphingobacterium lactis TaxID=797291 RepID=A0A1H6AX93_9SPHI|nr:hypothetical protein SAMN05421877_10931 [Sphingobacterium lactis]
MITVQVASMHLQRKHRGNFVGNHSMFIYIFKPGLEYNSKETSRANIR